MILKEKLTRLLSGAVSSAVMLSGMAVYGENAPFIEAEAASACTVNTNKTYQTIRGFGGMNLPEWQGYDLTSSQIQTVFVNGSGQLGLTVLRIYVSDDKNAWSRAIHTAKGAQQLGATVFATPWNPPSSMRSNGLVVGNMSAYVWWYIRRSYSLIGQDDGKPTKRGYMMAQYSKYICPGDVRIDCTEQPDSNLYVSAYKHSDTQIEIVAVNNGSSEKSQQFNISGRTITNVDRYRTSANENLAQTKGINASGSSFTCQIPANSVSTFVVTLTSDGKTVPSTPDQPVQHGPITPDANGYYYHDTFEQNNGEWEARGTSELTLSGRAPYQGTNPMKQDTKHFTYTSDFSQGNFYFLVVNSNDGVKKTHWWGYVRWYIMDALPYFFHEGN